MDGTFLLGQLALWMGWEALESLDRVSAYRDGTTKCQCTRGKGAGRPGWGGWCRQPAAGRDCARASCIPAAACLPIQSSEKGAGRGLEVGQQSNRPLQTKDLAGAENPTH